MSKAQWPFDIHESKKDKGFSSNIIFGVFVLKEEIWIETNLEGRSVRANDSLPSLDEPLLVSNDVSDLDDITSDIVLENLGSLSQEMNGQTALDVRHRSTK